MAYIPSSLQSAGKERYLQTQFYIVGAATQTPKYHFPTPSIMDTDRYLGKAQIKPAYFAMVLPLLTPQPLLTGSAHVM